MGKRVARAPKPGDKRPALENFRPAMGWQAPASEKEPTILPANYRVTLCAPAWARGARKPLKGGMMGGATGCCRGVTSNNGMGIVPAAFIK